MDNYGYCPQCGGRGVTRERRIDGNDTCCNRHSYPSKQAISKERKINERFNGLTENDKELTSQMNINLPPEAYDPPN